MQLPKPKPNETVRFEYYAGLQYKNISSFSCHFKTFC